MGAAPLERLAVLELVCCGSCLYGQGAVGVSVCKTYGAWAEGGAALPWTSEIGLCSPGISLNFR
jgi:hypothetical protein